MERHFRRSISAVRFRQRIQLILNDAAWGTFAAAFIVLFSPHLAATFFGVSIIIGLLRPNTASLSARLIDRHYRLKDRILTAFSLLRHPNRTQMQQLQVEDAADHLKGVQPKAVLPIRLPKMFWLAASVFAVDLAAVALMHNDFFRSNNTAMVVQTLPIDSETLREEIVAKAEELARLYSDEKSLLNLSEQLEMFMKKFETENLDAKEALMTLSEMEEAIQAAMDALQLETMDELIQELAKTLELAERTEPIGKALEKGDYNQAAMELKKIDAETLDSLSKPERKAMAEQMQNIADSAEKKNQKPMQEAAQQMSDALQNDDGDLAQSAADSLADEVEKHGIRQSINKDLGSKQMMLGAMKAESGLGMSGGKGTDKSKSSSETWGSGTAGDPNSGQETNLEGQRQQELLTGTLSEQGDSLTETIDSQEMTAAGNLRDYREQYLHYQKISEAVLDSEPIPLGQRQVIRRYFESIRPVTE